MSRRPIGDVAVGDALGELTVEVDRARLVAYAAASGDHNPIHWSDRIAAEAGLPGVIAHGMWTMGAASSLLTRWAGDPAAVVSWSCRFTRPVPVPDPGTAVLIVTGRVTAVDPAERTAGVDLDVRADTAGGAAVLGKARAVLRLA
ncbi:MAG: MaoC/PaaZ C-terminal domain-containing protein [Kineosporiaceae bacterium]